MTDTCDVIVFGAHPDDGEMGMAGTMIKLADAGYKVTQICLTKGEMGTYGTPEIRYQEFMNACKICGVTGEMLDFPDTDIQNTRENRIRIARIIRQKKPKIIFAPYHTNPLGELGGLAHVDHYTTGQLIRDAVKMARLEKTVPDVPKHMISKLYFYMVPRTVWPFLHVDVSDVIDRIEASIKAYHTQMAITWGVNQVQEIVGARRSSIGVAIGVKYAENFATDLPLKMTPKDFFGL